VSTESCGEQVESDRECHTGGQGEGDQGKEDTLEDALIRSDTFTIRYNSYTIQPFALPMSSTAAALEMGFLGLIFP
jgi:hypothetical protein